MAQLPNEGAGDPLGNVLAHHLARWGQVGRADATPLLRGGEAQSTRWRSRAALASGRDPAWLSTPMVRHHQTLKWRILGSYREAAVAARNRTSRLIQTQLHDRHSVTQTLAGMPLHGCLVTGELGSCDPIGFDVKIARAEKLNTARVASGAAGLGATSQRLRSPGAAPTPSPTASDVCLSLGLGASLLALHSVLVLASLQAQGGRKTEAWCKGQSARGKQVTGKQDSL